MDSTTVTRSEYVPKKGERYTVERPKEAGFVADSMIDDLNLYRQTSNLSDYGPKRAEKLLATRPTDSDVLKVNNI